MKDTPKPRIGADNVCPLTKEKCDDETCAPGAECNLSGNNIVMEQTNDNNFLFNYKGIKGHASFDKRPSKNMMQALAKMIELAYHKVKKKSIKTK